MGLAAVRELMHCSTARNRHSSITLADCRINLSCGSEALEPDLKPEL